MNKAVGLFYQQAAMAAMRKIAVAVGIAAVIGAGLWKVTGGQLSGWITEGFPMPS